jgi:hypothetical protein
MGVLANHVPSIEQLKPGLVEIIEEGGATKQFFCKFPYLPCLPFTCAVCIELSGGN